jgi:hypothetical protein
MTRSARITLLAFLAVAAFPAALLANARGHQLGTSRAEEGGGCVEREVLDGWIAEWPAEHRLVIDDQLVVLFTYPHPARLWSEAASIYDRASLSCVDLNSNGEIARRIDASEEGRQRLGRALADDALMARIRALIPWETRPGPS